jgi:hypothetical protein
MFLICLIVGAAVDSKAGIEESNIQLQNINKVREKMKGNRFC